MALKCESAEGDLDNLTEIYSTIEHLSDICEHKSTMEIAEEKEPM